MIFLKGFFDLIIEFIEITGNSTIDSILLSIIGIISFSVAFGIVGIIFDAFGKYDSDLMSDMHWTIRLIVFISLSAALIGVFKFFRWIFSFPWWAYIILIAVFIVIVIAAYCFKYRKSKKKLICVSDNEGNIGEISSIQFISRDSCPRCGGKLVKRHGPYGDFYGCENFPAKNCKYTRKFK